MGANRELTLHGCEELLKYLDWPLLSLGLSVAKKVSESAPLITHSYLALLFARSEQGQSAIWPMTEHHYYRERLMTHPAQSISAKTESQIIDVSQRAISQLPWKGSGLIRLTHSGDLIDITRGVQREGMWTIDHSRTSIFENEVRSQFNLPLGDVSLRVERWMTIEFSASEDLDMVRPYLHLCARNPRFKFHHFTTHRGVVSLSGEFDLVREDLEHAVDYLEAEINE